MNRTLCGVTVTIKPNYVIIIKSLPSLHTFCLYISREHTRETSRGTELQIPHWPYWLHHLSYYTTDVFLQLNNGYICFFKLYLCPPCLPYSQVILRANGFLTGWLKDQKEKNIVVVSGDIWMGGSLLLILCTFLTWVVVGQGRRELTVTTLRLCNVLLLLFECFKNAISTTFIRWHTRHIC